jgi:DNA-binding GntR family transcriptional regulator
MYKALNDALKFCSRGANQYFNKSWETGNPTDANGHVKIVDAIRHHDEKLAEELLIKDIECLWEQILG